MRHSNYLLILLLAAFALPACVTPVYYVRPKEWIVPGGSSAIVETFRPALTGRIVFLDPGHGGEDRVNRGPSGDAIEADVNLRVALTLRQYLAEAGAVVFLSRNKDTSIALRDRPRLAVASGAEIFISLHHNATGSRDDITNYSTVYYHAYEGHREYHPANHDLARFIERDMAYAMRNPSPPYSPTFDGTLSDFDIYPNSGFAVLRENPLPAVLIEGSFFSHPHEEQRLAIEEFNRIEAWGIFVGIGKYFRAGVPDLHVSSDSIVTIPRPVIRVSASPGPDIDRASVKATIDGIPVGSALADTASVFSITPSADLTSGDHLLRVEVKNSRGNWSWPFAQKIQAMLPTVTLSLTSTPPALPPDPTAMTRVECRAFDKDRNPVADGTLLHWTVRQPAVDTILRTEHGVASLYLTALSRGDSISAIVRAGGPSASIRIPIVSDSRNSYVEGNVTSTLDSLPIGGASIRFVAPDGSADEQPLGSTFPDGRFLAYQALPSSLDLLTRAVGFFAASTTIDLTSRRGTAGFALTPVAGGKLFAKTFLIDPRFGGSESGETTGQLRSSDLNLAIARRLISLLSASGANAVLVRAADTTIAEADRARFSARYVRGLYLRIDASGSGERASSEVHWNIPNQLYAGSLLKWLGIAAGLDSAGVTSGSTPFYRTVALATISIIVPAASSGHFDQAADQKIDAIAWGLFMGILERDAGFVRQPQPFRVIHRSTGAPLAGAEVFLDRTLWRYADGAGIIDFYGLARDGARVTAAEPAMILPLKPKP